jgi:hypothetical protein
MGVFPTDLNSKPANRVPKRRGFWRRLAQKLDSLAAYQTKRALSDSELRRVADDIKRCRQLIPNKPGAATATINKRSGV